MFEAESKGLKHEVIQAKQDIRSLKKARNEVRRAIKIANNEYSLFRRTTKPYQDAVKLLKQEENYRRFDEIAEMFEEAKARKEESDRLKEEAEEKEKAAKRAEIERLKNEKKLKKKK